MFIVDYLSREPHGFRIGIEGVYKARDCLSSRLNDTGGLDRNEIVLKHSKAKTSDNKRNGVQNTSPRSCYGNQHDPKRTRLDRNKSNQSS